MFVRTLKVGAEFCCNGYEFNGIARKNYILVVVHNFGVLWGENVICREVTKKIAEARGNSVYFFIIFAIVN